MCLHHTRRCYFPVIIRQANQGSRCTTANNVYTVLEQPTILQGPTTRRHTSSLCSTNKKKHIEYNACARSGNGCGVSSCLRSRILVGEKYWFPEYAAKNIRPRAVQISMRSDLRASGRQRCPRRIRQGYSYVTLSSQRGRLVERRSRKVVLTENED